MKKFIAILICAFYLSPYAYARTVITSAGTITNGSGQSNGSHLIYAENARVWVLYFTDNTTTTKIQSMVSSGPDLMTAKWTAGTASPIFINARAHGNDGRNYSVGYANISSSWDVVQAGIGITGGFDQTIRSTITPSGVFWGTWVELNTAATFEAPAHGALAFSGTSSPKPNECSIMLNTGRDAQCRVATNGDTGGAWTSGYQTTVVIDGSMANTCNTYFLTPVDTTGKMAAIYEDGAAATTMSSLRYNVMTVADTWPTTGSAAAIASLTTVSLNDWAGVRVTDSKIYTITRQSSANNNWLFSHYNGATTWTAKSAPPAQAQVSGSGVHLATDGTDVWAFVIDSANGNPIKWAKYTVASNSWAGWFTLEASAKTRNFISGYKVAKNNQINVLAVETNGSNFDICVYTLPLRKKLI